MASTHDLSWNFGPYGEGFGTYSFLFLGSQSQLEAAQPMEDDVSAPLPNEPCISIDWTLPMTASAQELLFSRIRSSFDKTTGTIPVGQKKKYRLTAEELLKLRNLCVLFDQVAGHLKSRLLPDQFLQWCNDMRTTSKRDEDFSCLIVARPPRFSLSMLPSQQEAAKVDMREVEQKKIEDKEAQQKEVLQAQWQFFCGALKRDHSKLEIVQAAPRLVRQKLHAKQVLHRSHQAKEGERACKGYQDRVHLSILQKLPWCSLGETRISLK